MMGIQANQDTAPLSFKFLKEFSEVALVGCQFCRCGA